MAEDIIADIIKYEGDNTTFIWKHPKEDFLTGTQLIVHESQEAVFFMSGQALDLFGPGRHTLETQNMPLVRKLFSKPTGGGTPFHCEVYFINKTEQMAIKWGTDSKVEYIEPTYGFPLQIGASGEMNLRVENSRQLLVKIVGTEHSLTQSSLVARFRAFLMTRMKTYLAQLIKSQKINIFEIDEHLVAMSGALQEMLTPDFADYGVALERFWVTTIVKPEDNRQYNRFKELHANQYLNVAEAQLKQQTDIIAQQTQAQKMKIEAEAMAYKRQVEGYSYQDERGFDVAERVASNEAVGQMSNLGVGLGVMAGVGGTVGGAVGGMMKNTMGNLQNQASQETVQTQAQASPQAQSAGISVEVRIANLEKLKGKIPEELYNAKLKEILDSI
jgi:membrane protease subunit (stomatin/prohibitin family)